MTVNSKQPGGLSPEGREAILARRASWVIFALSALIASIHFAAGRALWLDEAMIALNLRDLGWHEIIRKLEYSQMAPIGWLAVQKALLEITGNLEYGLRIFSLVAWLGSALLFRDMCFRLFAPFAATCGFTLFAFSAILLKYAVELKHYEVDVLVATAALWSCVTILSNDRFAWRSWALFALAAAVGVFFSFGGLFAIAGSALAILLRGLKARRMDNIVALGVIGGLCLLIFAWLMLSVYRPMISGSGLVEGGNDAFFNRTSYLPMPTSLADLAWLPKWLWTFLLYAFSSGSRAGATMLIGVGLVVVFGRRPELLLATVGPLLIGLLASSINAYPMFERLTLFALPGLFLAIAFAIAWFADKLLHFRGATLALLATALVGPLVDTAYFIRLSPPYANQDIKPVMRALSENIASNDKIYVTNLAIPAWLLYRNNYRLRHQRWTPGLTNVVSWPCLIRDMRSLQPGETVWVVAIQTSSELENNGLLDSLAVMGLIAKHDVVVIADGAVLHRLQLSAAERPSSTLPNAECGVDGTNAYLYPPERFRDFTISTESLGS